MKIIESPQNDYFKTLLKLLKSPGIKKEQKFLLMGSKIVEEIWSEQEESVHVVLLFDENQGHRFGNSKKCLLLSKELFKELDIFDTRSPILVMPLPKISNWKSDNPQGLELFLPVQDPANLGAIIRSAVAFDVTKIILLKECANPFHPKSIRASSGMVLKMRLETGPSLKDLSEVEDFYSLDQGGKEISNFKWPKNLRLVVGEEGQGLPENLKKNILSIQINAQCESLNVMAATSIALNSYHRTHKS